MECVAPRERSIFPIASTTAEMIARRAKQAGLHRADREISNKHFDLLANNLALTGSTRETFPGISATTQVTAVNP